MVGAAVDDIWLRRCGLGWTVEILGTELAAVLVAVTEVARATETVSELIVSVAFCGEIGVKRRAQGEGLIGAVGSHGTAEAIVPNKIVSL